MKGYGSDRDRKRSKVVFRSGDLAVRHPDGYIEIKDRLKDVIISGENIVGQSISYIGFQSLVQRLSPKWTISGVRYLLALLNYLMTPIDQ